MNRAKLSYVIDAFIGISFLVCGITGILKIPLLIRTFALNQTLPYKTISIIHDWSGALMVFFALTHVIMHWRWIVAMTKNLFRK